MVAESLYSVVYSCQHMWPSQFSWASFQINLRKPEHKIRATQNVHTS